MVLVNCHMLSTSFMLSERESGMEGNRSRFLGVETNEILIPFSASFLESSKNGSMWPKANHGNTITWHSSTVIEITEY